MEECSWETSLERSFQSISIDDEESSTEFSPGNQSRPASKLINSQEFSPPFQNWDHYLDLKTGDVFYVDWRSGRKMKKVGEHAVSSLQISQEEEEEHRCNSQDDSEGEEDVHLHTTNIGEGSPTESDCASCSTPESMAKAEDDNVLVVAEDVNLHTTTIGEGSPTESDCASCFTPESLAKVEDGDVLVVAGCRRCLTYFMLPKTASECPKCKDSLSHLNSFF